MKKKIILLSIILTFLTATPFGFFVKATSYETVSHSFFKNSDNHDLETQAATAGILSGAIYRIKNVGSGKYLNIHNGIDANGTNAYQWNFDGSIEQKFKVVYSVSSDSYKFYAMCSSNGNGRVLDITRGTTGLDPVTAGQNVKLWIANDPISQDWQIIPLGHNQYRIRPSANSSVYLAACGDSNGSSGGTTAISPGNVYISDYIGDAHQHWMFELVEEESSGIAIPTGWLDNVSSTSISGWAWRSDIPDSPIDVHVYIRNSKGENVSILILTANQYRADLLSAGYGNGYHGFSGTINWSNFVPGTYYVTVYAIGYNGNNPVLQGCPKSYILTSKIGYKGYAVYRDLAGVMGVVSDDWHSGLMDEPYAANNKSVIHVSGLGNSVVDWIDWNDFIGNKTYHGVYRPRQEMSDYDRIQVVNLARELRTKDIGYILSNQMRATIWPDATWIYPNDIVDLRCDGLVEYCFEYYGFRIYGDDSRWDISRSSTENLAHHNLGSVTPKNQAQNYMVRITADIPHY